MESKDWKERLKIEDGDWFGWSLFIDGEAVLNEYRAGWILLREAEGKLKNFIEEVREEAREEVITEIYNFVEGESGRSGRKEILEFISKLTTK